jgi:hypothetical protein
VKKDALLSRMWRRNAIHDRYQALCVQELRLVRNTAGTDGAKRQAQTEYRNSRRRAAEEEKRIPEMVSEQEKVELSSVIIRKPANSIKGLTASD